MSTSTATIAIPTGLRHFGPDSTTAARYRCMYCRHHIDGAGQITDRSYWLYRPPAPDRLCCAETPQLVGWLLEGPSVMWCYRAGCQEWTVITKYTCTYPDHDPTPICRAAAAEPVEHCRRAILE